MIREYRRRYLGESFPNQAENHSEINKEHSKHARSEENPITSCLIPKRANNLLGSEKNTQQFTWFGEELLRPIFPLRTFRH